MRSRLTIIIVDLTLWPNRLLIDLIPISQLQPQTNTRGCKATLHVQKPPTAVASLWLPLWLPKPAPYQKRSCQHQTAPAHLEEQIRLKGSLSMPLRNPQDNDGTMTESALSFRGAQATKRSAHDRKPLWNTTETSITRKHRRRIGTKIAARWPSPKAHGSKDHQSQQSKRAHFVPCAKSVRELQLWHISHADLLPLAILVTNATPEQLVQHYVGLKPLRLSHLRVDVHIAVLDRKLLTPRASMTHNRARHLSSSQGASVMRIGVPQRKMV